MIRFTDHDKLTRECFTKLVEWAFPDVCNFEPQYLQRAQFETDLFKFKYYKNHCNWLTSL